MPVFALLGRFFTSCLHAGLREVIYVLVGSFFLIVVKFGAWHSVCPYVDFMAIFFIFVFLLLATLANEAWLRFSLSDQYKVPVPVAMRFGRGDFVQIATAFQRDSGSHIGQQGLPDAPSNLKNSACCWNQELCAGQSGLSVSLWARLLFRLNDAWMELHICSWLFLIVCCHKAVALSSCFSWG